MKNWRWILHALHFNSSFWYLLQTCLAFRLKLTASVRIKCLLKYRHTNHIDLNRSKYSNCFDHHIMIKHIRTNILLLESVYPLLTNQYHGNQAWYHRSAGVKTKILNKDKKAPFSKECPILRKKWPGLKKNISQRKNTIFKKYSIFKKCTIFQKNALFQKKCPIFKKGPYFHWAWP